MMTAKRGLIWEKLTLSEKSKRLTFFALIFGTFVNWLTVLFAGIVGAGSEMMPLAGGTLQGTALQEALIKIGLVSLSIAMVFASVMLLIGLKSK